MKKIIVMGIPHHGNIGDNAIAVAEEEILSKYFGEEYKIYYMQEKFLDVCANRVKKFINDEDIILLHGGGNIGDTYVRPEKGRREVIKTFPNNKIIIFPQTAYFSNTKEGKNELEKSKQIYNSHKNLIIMAREEKSYEFIKKHFYKARVYLTPDIVMSMVKKSDKNRKGALLLFRTDKEKTLEDNNIELIKDIMTNKYGKYILSDMSLGSGIVNISGEVRDNVLNSKFNEFQTSEIVITDRLHGMIFAAITETPCVVFGNFNHKIKESYKWLQNLKYISFCEDINHLEECIKQVSNVKEPKYDNNFAEAKIVKILKEEILK